MLRCTVGKCSATCFESSCTSARNAQSSPSIWGRGAEALARAAVRRVRCRIEKVFGTWTRSYGLRRMRWIGLAKAGLQVRLAAMAYNLRRTVTLLPSAAA